MARAHFLDFLDFSVADDSNSLPYSHTNQPKEIPTNQRRYQPTKGSSKLIQVRSNFRYFRLPFFNFKKMSANKQALVIPAWFSMLARIPWVGNVGTARRRPRMPICHAARVIWTSSNGSSCCAWCVKIVSWEFQPKNNGQGVGRGHWSWRLTRDVGGVKYYPNSLRISLCDLKNCERDWRSILNLAKYRV